jgi:hypothetical protein
MLTFQSDSILQKTGDQEKIWTFPEILESYDPLYGEPLAERTAALQKAAQLLLKTPVDLSENARLHLDFWENFQPRKFAWQSDIFKATVGETFHWELKINELGVFFRDVSGQYDTHNDGVSAQLFSDFWFFGPRRPIPDLMLREKLIDLLKKAFANPDCPAAQAHFELFEYPKKSLSGLQWVEGDYVRSDFVNVRDFGIEMGYTTFRDGPFGPGFLSFERFLNVPPQELSFISPEMRTKIEDYLGKYNKFSPPKPVETEPKPLTPREKMDLAESLLQNPNSDEGAEILISLLEFETESDYWRNYVFNRCAKLRENRRVRNFIAGCLRGDNETWFKKSCDVLSYWGFFLGDKKLADKSLLFALNWEDATAGDPDFRAALEKTLKIINP